MRELQGKNIVVLDVETLYSAETCVNCHSDAPDGCVAGCPGYQAIGWNDYRALGLSIGGYYDYEDARVHWFDAHTMRAAVGHLVRRRCTIVTYNGLRFDLPLLTTLYEYPYASTQNAELVQMAQQASALVKSQGYDILDAMWQADPAHAKTRGINGLDAVAQANGLGGKTLGSGGLIAPALWRAGRHAEVINYCQQDILLTKAVFEMVMRGEPIKRNNGSEVVLPRPRGMEE
jgi:hypothetical protein